MTGLFPGDKLVSLEAGRTAGRGRSEDRADTACPRFPAAQEQVTGKMHGGRTIGTILARKRPELLRQGSRRFFGIWLLIAAGVH